MRQVAGRLRLELAQFRELEAFAKFGSEELDKATRDQLERGRRITEILKQPINLPMSLGKQSSILYAVTNGYLDDVPVEKVISWEENFHRFMETNHPDIEKFITAKKGNRGLRNFNISVSVPDNFMMAAREGEEYELLNPRDGKPVMRMNARYIFDMIAYNAWRGGDPGVIFIDRMNKHNPTPHLGKIESTNHAENSRYFHTSHVI
jgi:hypothetical protein